MKTLNLQLKEIEIFIEMGDLQNTTVSRVSTYWQLDHSLRVLIGIPKAIENSNPEEYQPKFSILKWFIMTFKKIPRGKGRAPKNVLPEDNIMKTDLLKKLNLAKKGLKDLNLAHTNAYFTHPIFGHFNVEKSRIFLNIHTEHHLKIVRDIVKK